MTKEYAMHVTISGVKTLLDRQVSLCERKKCKVQYFYLPYHKARGNTKFCLLLVWKA